MRVAVLSDVHGNLHALEAVLDEIDAARPDLVWCLGDLVGYGPRPNECCAHVRERTDVCLVGNHDLAVLGALDIDDFAPDAAAAARWTRGVLDLESREFLESLEPRGMAEGVALFHGSARDPVWEYVLTAEAALGTFARTSASVVLVGHSHVALALRLDGGGLDGGTAAAGAEVDLSDARWLLNPGSVGQPRDGDPRAGLLMLDFGRGRASFRRVPYAIERTQDEIRAEGLPELLAARLAEGL